MSSKLDRFIAEHRFDRSLTLDLLQSLTDEELLWSPGPNVGRFWKQFRHVGRVQEDYMRALDSGTVKFEAKNGSFTNVADRSSILQYLRQMDVDLEARLATLDENKVIDWFGVEKLSVFDHLLRMLGHESLHHGQWIIYCKLMNKPFPSSWSIWGLG